MNIRQLKEYIKDLPDDMEIIHWGWEWWFKVDSIGVLDNKLTFY
jgi:hypothetical protein